MAVNIYTEYAMHSYPGNAQMASSVYVHVSVIMHTHTHNYHTPEAVV